MRICFDLDNTLCTGKPYETAEPFPGVKDLLLKLKEEGHTIIIQTARGMATASSNPGKCVKNIGRLTLEQLDAWGFLYDEIYFGKPNADLFVDDKAFHASKLQKLWSFIEKTEAFDSHYESKLCKLEASLRYLEESK